MVGSEDKTDLDIDNRKSCEDAAGQCIPDTLVNSRDIFLGNDTTDNLVLELVPCTRLLRLHLNDDVTVLAAST